MIPPVAPTSLHHSPPTHHPPPALTVGCPRSVQREVACCGRRYTAAPANAKAGAQQAGAQCDSGDNYSGNDPRLAAGGCLPTLRRAGLGHTCCLPSCRAGGRRQRRRWRSDFALDTPDEGCTDRTDRSKGRSAVGAWGLTVCIQGSCRPASLPSAARRGAESALHVRSWRCSPLSCPDGWILLRLTFCGQLCNVSTASPGRH